jgi:DNA topoisomerase-1
MRNRHVRVAGAKVKFHFNGKSGQVQELELDDRRLTAVVKRCRDLPGHNLFQYVDDGELHNVDSTKVNEYLRDIAGHEITAKHFRTWHGTVQAAIELTNQGSASSERVLRQNVANAVRAVSKRLGNKPATCRKYYIHPAIIEAYGSGRLVRQMTKSSAPARRGLSSAEQRVLGLLRRLGNGRTRTTAPSRAPHRKRIRSNA